MTPDYIVLWSGDKISTHHLSILSYQSLSVKELKNDVDNNYCSIILYKVRIDFRRY